jgi:anti-sigma-K factor RskA
MNIQEIIESGVIELYVMNALPKDEAAQVEALAVKHPEIRKEIEAIETSLEQYAQAHAVEPRPELKEEIFKKTENTPLNQNSSEPNSVSQVPPLSIKWTWLWAVAASLVAIVSLFHNFNQRTALSNCTSENTKLIGNQKVVAELEYKLDILRRADTKPIEMKGLAVAPDAKILLYWNPKKKAILLSIQNLPAPPKGKQYQLWAIVDKKPVDGGVFAYDVTAVQQMKPFEHAEAFAVTLEPEGGSTAPTMNDMYVMGAVL